MSKASVSAVSRFKTPYCDYLAVPGMSFEGESSRTKQAEMAACDINNIMDQFARTGLLPQSDVPMVFGAFSDGNDYQEKLNCVLTAQESFMALDARVRARFGNDPAHLLNFLANPENRDEAIKLGLVDQKTDTEGEKISPPPAGDKTKSSE